MSDEQLLASFESLPAPSPAAVAAAVARLADDGPRCPLASCNGLTIPLFDRDNSLECLTCGRIFVEVVAR